MLVRVHALFEPIPESPIALLARFSITATFWNAGQTKVEGFVLNIVSGEFALGWPRLSSSAVDLFRDEYKLPLLPPELAAVMAAVGDHAGAHRQRREAAALRHAAHHQRWTRKERRFGEAHPARITRRVAVPRPAHGEGRKLNIGKTFKPRAPWP